MNQKILFVLIITLFFTASVFALEGENESSIPDRISNNEYYLRSLQLNKLAAETYEYGDYDASAGFAEEAIRYAELSDEYVSVQLIAEAKRLLAWADNNSIAAKFPNNYLEGKTQYENAVDAHSNENWNEAIDSAVNAIEIFAAFETGRPATTTTRPAATTATGTLPKQYTVRTWRVEKDCLWTIAGYSWVYGDPWRWRELYNANKDKMPEAANPDLILPGMVLDIPSIQGESRQGIWNPNR
jgi:hypothetical protein